MGSGEFKSDLLINQKNPAQLRDFLLLSFAFEK